MDIFHQGPALSVLEKKMILNTYQYVKARREGNLPHDKLTLRKEVSRTVGVSESTVGALVSYYNKHKDLPKVVPTGRPSVGIDFEIEAIIRDTISDGNKNGFPVTSKLIANTINEKGFPLSSRTVRRYCKKMGFRYGKGDRYNILHEKTSVVEYRMKYLERRFANLNANMLLIKFVIFLDESKEQ